MPKKAESAAAAEARQMRTRSEMNTYYKFFNRAISLFDLKKTSAVLAAITSLVGIIVTSIVIFTYKFPPQGIFSPSATIEPQATSTATPSTALPPTYGNVSNELASIEGKLSNIDDRLSNIENIVVDNPEKAIELLSLRMDLDELNRQYESDITDIQRDIDNAYKQMNWFIGICLTLSISIFTLTYSILRKGNDKTNS